MGCYFFPLLYTPFVNPSHERPISPHLTLAPPASRVRLPWIYLQGVGDVQLAAQLVSLKERYPSRVTLLMGNRDINKMKLTSDLHPSDCARPAETIPGAPPPTKAALSRARRTVTKKLATPPREYPPPPDKTFRRGTSGHRTRTASGPG